MAPIALQIYLFQSVSDDPWDLLRGEDIREVERLHDPGFDCQVFAQLRAGKERDWAGYVGGHFNLSPPTTSQVAVVLMARVDGRQFAVTFGDGHRLLRDDLLVSDFGLRVTANELAPDAMKGIGTTTLGTQPRRTEQRRSAPGNRHAFSPGLITEWVRKLAGTSSATGRTVQGSVHLTRPLPSEHADLTSLPRVLREATAQYQSTAYQQHFGFIDRVEEVAPGKVRTELDTEMLNRIHHPKLGGVGCAIPDEFFPRLEGREIESFRIHGAGLNSGPRTELSDDWARDLIRLCRRVGPLTHLKVQLFDGQGEQVDDRKIGDFLTADITRGREHFVRLAGKWLRIHRDFYEELDSDLRDLKNLTGQLGLRDWWVQENEGRYNFEASGDRFAHLDQKLFTAGPDRGKVEIADLLSPDLHLVCVKRLSRSATLSHLFAQGSVSAELYCGDSQYRATVNDHYERHWGETPPPGQIPTVVYGLGTTREAEDLTRVLPFFSKVNLREHVWAIRNLPAPVEVALAKIPMVQQRPGSGQRTDRMPRKTAGRESPLFDIDGPGG